MISAVLLAAFVTASNPLVELQRVPNGGIQPQLVKDAKGVAHLLYYKGDAGAGDLFYIRSEDDGASWSAARRVNPEPGMAVAAGTIRGGQLAVAQNAVHVIWNGTKGKAAAGMHQMGASQEPLLYTRSLPDGTFEKPRNLMGATHTLDGGSSIAANEKGQVFVVWHAFAAPNQTEQERMVWIARSTDAGKSFSKERPIWDQKTGACACCGLKAAATKDRVLVAYRSAKEGVDRDSYLLSSSDEGKTFSGRIVSKWRVNTCPMSSYWISQGPNGVTVGVEERGTVLFQDTEASNGPFKPTTETFPAKYPTSASNDKFTLNAWTEGTGWNKGGQLVWQATGAKGDNSVVARGRREGIPAWSFPAVLPRKDGGFTILY